MPVRTADAADGVVRAAEGAVDATDGAVDATHAGAVARGPGTPRPTVAESGAEPRQPGPEINAAMSTTPAQREPTRHRRLDRSRQMLVGAVLGIVVLVAGVIVVTRLFGDDDSSEVVFGADEMSGGLALMSGGDADVEMITVGRPEEQAWSTGNGRILPSSAANSDQDWYMLFNVDDGIIYRGQPTTQVRIEIEFFDAGPDQFRLEYDSTTSTHRESELFSKTGTGDFRTATSRSTTPTSGIARTAATSGSTSSPTGPRSFAGSPSSSVDPAHRSAGGRSGAENLEVRRRPPGQRGSNGFGNRSKGDGRVPMSVVTVLGRPSDRRAPRRTTAAASCGRAPCSRPARSDVAGTAGAWNGGRGERRLGNREPAVVAAHLDEVSGASGVLDDAMSDSGDDHVTRLGRPPSRTGRSRRRSTASTRRCAALWSRVRDQRPSP